MTERKPRQLVVDTSVAVKFYVPEEGREKALELLAAAHRGSVELLAPGTLLPEAFNAIAQQERRGLLDMDDVREAWKGLLRAPVYTYSPEDLVERPFRKTSWRS